MSEIFPPRLNAIIAQSAAFCERGQRANNEDAVYPVVGRAQASDNIFLVCDGVGGLKKGEVASALVCKTMAASLAPLTGDCIAGEDIMNAIRQTRKAFEDIAILNGETAGMASTMALLCFDTEKAVIAHIGDSRVYHIRNGEILYKTRDHKWVNDLVACGMLTEEQAQHHPKRNVVTRVVDAARNDEPDIAYVRELRPGDYFFLCTDGVLEQVYDDLLTYHLQNDMNGEMDVAELMETIRNECAGKTADNFSACLIKIKKIQQA